MSALKMFSSKVAAKVVGAPEEQMLALVDDSGATKTTVGNLGAISDWLPLIESIAQIVMQLLQNCPAKKASLVSAAKRPNFMQRLRLRSISADVFRGSTAIRWRDAHGAVADRIMAEAANMNDEELGSVIDEAQSPLTQLI